MFGGVRIGIGCMSLVAVISRYTWVPVNLRVKFDIRNLRHTLIAGNLSDLVVSLYVEALRKMERYVYRICKGFSDMQLVGLKLLYRTNIAQFT